MDHLPNLPGPWPGLGGDRAASTRAPCPLEEREGSESGGTSPERAPGGTGPGPACARSVLLVIVAVLVSVPTLAGGANAVGPAGADPIGTAKVSRIDRGPAVPMGSRGYGSHDPPRSAVRAALTNVPDRDFVPPGIADPAQLLGMSFPVGAPTESCRVGRDSADGGHVDYQMPNQHTFTWAA